jgi:hypothetical protein
VCSVADTDRHPAIMLLIFGLVICTSSAFFRSCWFSKNIILLTPQCAGRVTLTSRFHKVREAGLFHSANNLYITAADNQPS